MVMQKSMMKYMTSIGQNTGTLKASKKVQIIAITMPFVAECLQQRGQKQPLKQAAFTFQDQMSSIAGVAALKNGVEFSPELKLWQPPDEWPKLLILLCG